MIEIRKVSLTLLGSILVFKAFSQAEEQYETVIKLDSTFFKAYNTCDMKTQEEFYSDSIEFTTTRVD